MISFCRLIRNCHLFPPFLSQMCTSCRGREGGLVIRINVTVFKQFPPHYATKQIQAEKLVRKIAFRIAIWTRPVVCVGQSGGNKDKCRRYYRLLPCVQNEVGVPGQNQIELMRIVIHFSVDDFDRLSLFIRVTHFHFNCFLFKGSKDTNNKWRQIQS